MVDGKTASSSFHRPANISCASWISNSCSKGSLKTPPRLRSTSCHNAVSFVMSSCVFSLITISNISILKQSAPSLGYFTASSTLNFTTSPLMLNVMTLSLTLMRASPVAKNGLPNSKGMSGSSCMSKTMKSAGKKYLSTCTKMSSRIPSGFTMDLSANCKATGVYFKSSTIFRLFATDNGIKLTPDPRSHKAFAKCLFPISTGIVGMPGSFSFNGMTRPFLIMQLQLLLNVMMSPSLGLDLLLIISFMNLPYLGTFPKRS